jgi:hypothetical protein
MRNRYPQDHICPADYSKPCSRCEELDHFERMKYPVTFLMRIESKLDLILELLKK